MNVRKFADVASLINIWESASSGSSGSGGSGGSSGNGNGSGSNSGSGSGSRSESRSGSGSGSRSTSSGSTSDSGNGSSGNGSSGSTSGSSNSTSGSSGSSSSSGLKCPSGKGFQSLMKKGFWTRPKSPGADKSFNWFVHGDVWRVRPTRCGTDFSPEDQCTSAVISIPAASPNRNLNTLESICEFSDFALKLDFRCPNTRGNPPNWTKCNSPITGPENWGNSGVKIFLDTAPTGTPRSIEIQILDSWGIAWPPNRPTNGKTNLGGCPAGSTNPVIFGEICGALYKLKTPDSNPVKQATGWINPGGEWNSMLIEYMAARFSSNNPNAKIKCGTIRVTLNGAVIHSRWGYTGTPVVKRVPDIDANGNPVYTNGAGWFREAGPVILQEHDTKVEFRGIQIDPGWLPGGAQFDQTWQRVFQGGKCQ